MSDIAQELESLRRAQKELEALVADIDEGGDERDSRAAELVKKIDDPVERARAEAALRQGQALAVHAKSINLLMRHVLGLQAAVLVLADKLGDLEDDD